MITQFRGKKLFERLQSKPSFERFATLWPEVTQSSARLAPTSYPRWIIAPLRTSPTPPTERGCLSFRSPSSSAQSLGGGTAHKQTRPVNNMKDHRETRLRSFLESTAEVGQPLYRLQLSAEERLFKLSFPRVTLLVQSGETLPINRLC